MRGVAAFFLAGMLAVAVWLWGFGGADLVSRWAVTTQRDVQNAMAASLRALRAGEPGALSGLWLLCATYGFAHAAGPGHGKLVIGGYGMGVRVPVRRLAGLAALSSVAQAFTAIIVASVALALLGWGRAQLTDLADQTMAPLSYALIAGVGLWLFWRGLRKAWRVRGASDDHDGTVCASCGHAHGPTARQAAAVRSWRDGAAVVAAIAIRPCTGALFLLILTHAFGIYWIGVVGVLIMGLGTAGFTLLVAIAAASARESAFAQAASARTTAVLLAGTEVIAGAVIVTLALQLLLRAL